MFNQKTYCAWSINMSFYTPTGINWDRKACENHWGFKYGSKFQQIDYTFLALAIQFLGIPLYCLFLVHTHRIRYGGYKIFQSFKKTRFMIVTCCVLLKCYLHDISVTEGTNLWLASWTKYTRKFNVEPKNDRWSLARESFVPSKPGICQPDKWWADYNPHMINLSNS